MRPDPAGSSACCMSRQAGRGNTSWRLHRRGCLRHEAKDWPSSMTDERDAWKSMLDEIDARIDAVGYWNGEARVLRDALGRRRLGTTGAALIREKLEGAGFELDGPPPPFESDPVMIRRRGAGRLAAEIERLL